MVPMYSLASFLPLVIGDKSFVVERIKDCYEAFLIYTFLAYIFVLLGEESEIVGKIQVRLCDDCGLFKLSMTCKISFKKSSMCDPRP